MREGKRDVWITGIGLVSSLGEGLDAHWAALNGEGLPVTDAETFAPYVVHPLIKVNYDQQIPKKGDQRQMEAWQRIGTYAAGLALESAGVAKNAEILGRTDMIVAAGGGGARLSRRRRYPERPVGLQRLGPLAERATSGRPAPHPLAGAIVEPVGRQYFHRPRRHRILAHLHGRRERRGGCDRIAFSRIAAGQSEIGW